MDCKQCQGRGHIAIRNGDDDIECKYCGGIGERQLTLPEAMWIVSQNKNGLAMNYWDEYLPAILLVNEAFPITGYNLIEGDDSYFEDMDYIQFQHEQIDYQEFLKRG